MSVVLGTFEQAVLLAIVRLGEKAYGRSILKEVQTRLARDVAAGAIYATLDRIEEKGLATSRLATGTPQRGGRARRYYAISASGVRAVNESRATAECLWHGIRWPLKERA